MRPLTLCLLLCATLAPAQVITTVAGTDPVFPTAGIPALTAPLRLIAGVATDSAGNFYATDQASSIVARVSPDGTLVVVAGNGRPGFGGDGGPATNASLNSPRAVALDAAGNLYITDAGNNRIRMVSGGTITTVAGNGTAGFSGDGGPATSAKLNNPATATVDSAGNIYIADNNRVRKVTGGTITTVAGNGGNKFSGDGPATSVSLTATGLVADASGNVYIADAFNYRVRKLSNGSITTVAGNGTNAYSGDGGPATAAGLVSPVGLALDGAGNLYISDQGDFRVRKITGGIISTVAGNGSEGTTGSGPATAVTLFSPNGLALDAANNLYIADLLDVARVSAGTIARVAGNVTGGSFAGDGGAPTSAALNRPSGVAVDAAGKLYIADTSNNRIRTVSGGKITTVAGNGTAGFSGDGGPATSASLNQPYGVAVDPQGNLYIADTSNHRIRKVSGGTIATVAGNGQAGFSGDGPGTSVQLLFPNSVALDSAGGLYIADTGNHRIRKLSGGTIATVAGNGNAAYSGDGGPATAAALNSPFGVALDSAGNLFIGDTNNNRVREVSNGTITTVAGTGTGGFSGDKGPATAAGIFHPTGVAIDPAGNLYFGDQANERVRKVSGGTITTVAGTGVEGALGDGGLANNAQLYGVYALALDAAGDLYIASAAANRIREILAVNPSYQAAPSTLSFSGTAGAAATSAQVIGLSSAVPGLAFTASSTASWLSVTPSAGTLPTTLQVTADPSGLTAGSYQGSILIAVPFGAPAATSVSVTFTVQAATPALLAVDTQNIAVSASQGGGPVARQFQVLNTGGGPLAFTITTVSAGGSWLSVTPTSGTATASSPVSVTAIATPGALPPGTYSGRITIKAGAVTIGIPVSLSVSAPSASILLSQSALSFTAVAQGGAPLPRVFGILNIGQGSMDWTAAVSTLTGGNWLSVSPASGTVARPYLDVSLVNASVDPSTLAPGTYYGRIQVSAPAVNTPQSITVILAVLPPGSALPAQVFPAGLIFTGAAGVTPGSQDVQVGNPAGTTVSFVSGIIGTGLDYLPKNASLQPSQPTTVHVYPDFSQLSPGSIQQGTITLQFSDFSPSQTINVLTVLAPSATGSSGLLPHAQTCTNLKIVFREPQPNQSTFTATVGQSTTLDMQVTDGCGNLLGPQNAGVKATFSNGDSVPLVNIGNGIWQGSWRPSSAGTVQMQVTAFASGSNGNVLSGQSPVLTASVSGAVTPVVSAVAHAASAQALPIAPGGLITIYGQNLADTAGLSNGVPLPDQLNGAQVLSGNLLLPIVYAGPTQLNVQVPYGVPVNTLYQLTVQHGNSYSVPQQLVVAQAEPGIFTTNSQGFGQGSIVKSDGVTLAQPGTPARIGETVVIYCTGLGPVTPQVPEGVAPPGSPLSTAVNPVTATIGGQPATVSFAGLTPGDPGLYQINAIVPSGIATGDAVPVVISVAGQTSPISPPVTMAVK